MRLKVGKRYHYPGGGVVEVLKINFSRALVRPVGRVVVEFEVNGVDQVDFSRPHQAFSISPNSVLRETDEHET